MAKLFIEIMRIWIYWVKEHTCTSPVKNCIMGFPNICNRMVSCSEEVGDNISVGNGLRTLSNCVENIKWSLKLLVNVQNRGNISASVAVVRGRPYCHQCLILEPVLETVHDKLVSTSNELQIIDMIEFWCYSLAKNPACSSRRHSPGINFLRIRPHEIAERALMRNLHASINKSDLIKGLDFWG